MTDFATESGHWYGQDGEPRYTIIGKNGKERNTTLRDARVLDLVPSVTGIIKMAAAPGLERWKRNQVLLAALTLPHNPDETESDWLARVEQDWQEQGRQAASNGTAIHGAIERFYRGDLNVLKDDYHEWVIAAIQCLNTHCGLQKWHPERSFASTSGYGGKIDLHSDEWVVDVKTKDGSLDEIELYDEHKMQLAAYRYGLGLNARCGILFVGRDEPKARFIETTTDDIIQGLDMFMCLLGFWKAKNKVS